MRAIRKEVTDLLNDLKQVCFDPHARGTEVASALDRVIVAIEGEVPAILRPAPIADDGIRLVLRYVENRFRPATHQRPTLEWFMERLDHVDEWDLRELLAGLAIDLRDVAEGRKPAR